MDFCTNRERSRVVPEISRVLVAALGMFLLMGAQQAQAQAQSQFVPSWDLQVDGWTVTTLSLEGDFGGPYGAIIDNGLMNDRANSVGRSCTMYEGFTWSIPLDTGLDGMKFALAEFDSMLLNLSLDMVMTYGMLEREGPLGGLSTVTFRSGDHRLFGVLGRAILEGKWHYRFTWCYAA